MYVRRLVKAGQASHTLSLPKEWLEKNKLKKGDMIYIHEHSGTDLLLTPEKREITEQPKEVTISIAHKDIGTIQRELTSAYLNNYSTIILSGDNPALLKQVRDLIHNFIALEVSEQNTSRIVAKDLLNLSEISIQKTVRRMDMILRSLLKDSQLMAVGAKVHESIAFRDEDINRLYFMLLRLLKKAINNPDVAQKFELTNQDILSTWDLILHLENIGDAVHHICGLKETIKLHDTTLLEKLHEYIDINFKDVMKAHYNKDKSLANKVAGGWVEFSTLADEFFTKNKTPEAALMKEHFKEVFSLISTIARIVMDNDDASPTH